MKYIYFLLITIFISIESCTNKKVEPITPIADFTFELGKNGEIKFVNTSQNASSSQWEFGDSESSTETNPIHIYKIENVYKIKLIVSSKDNIKNEIIKEININNFSPKASFEYSLGDNGLIKFRNTSIHSKAFTWSFGDGETSTETNPSHTYNANSKYIIKLVATNSNSKDSTQSEIQINSVSTTTSQLFKCGINQVSIFDKKNYRCSIKHEGKFNFDTITELEYYFSRATDSLGVLVLRFQNNKGFGNFVIQEGFVEYHPNYRYEIKNAGKIELKLNGNIIEGNFNGKFKDYINQEKEFSGNFEIEKK